MANTAKDDMIKKVALGATGVALAAGAVAAGVTLARSKKARTTLKRGVRRTIKGIERVRGVLEEGQERYQAIQHRIAASGKKGLMKKSAHGRGKGRKS